MFSMSINANSSVPNRQLRFDGMIHYYKRGWLSNKWTVVYAKLWSDSTLEWFQSKGATTPQGSIFLSTLIPYICVGRNVRKIPTKKPRIEATWTRDFLMAVSMDQKASSVHWFYFENGDNMRQWLNQMTSTLPRYNPSNQGTYPTYPRQNNMGYGNDYAMRQRQPFNTTYMNDQPRGIQVSINGSTNSNRQHQRKRNSFDRLFDETFLNYGIGNFFFPMNVDQDRDSESDSDWDNWSTDSSCDDNDFNRRNNSIFNDDNIHVSRNGITIQTGETNNPTQNEFGNGFSRVHRFEL